jgi:Carboxypeptidase regulatory-like domain
MALLNGAPFRAIAAKLASVGLYLTAVLLVGDGEARAQVLYGSLVGNVKDTSGAAVPGAEVTITHKESNQPRSMTTDDTGAYSFAAVSTGTYTLNVRLTGFKEWVKTDVPVTLNNTTRIDVTLELGAMTEVVTVTGVTPLLQTDRAEVRAEIGEEELENLPVPLGRNYQHLFDTLPGFTPPEEAHSIQSNPSRSLAFNVNGVSRSINNTRIDGASSINPWLPHITAYVPSLEAIQTVNVVSNSFDAEQGLAGGAAISVQLKSGTNEFHGSLFEHHHNHLLRARQVFYPIDQKKGKFIYNQWGATLGGPIVKKKLFFFTSYEGTSDHRNANRIVSVPTLSRRSGNFSDSTTIIYDPLTGNADGSQREPFPDNIVPDNRKDPVALRIIQLLPQPNLARADGTFAETNNYFASGSSVFDRWSIDNKIDWHVSGKLNMFGRYSILGYTSDQPTVFGRALVGRPLTTFGGGGGNGGTGEGNSYNFSYGMNYIFGPRFLMDTNIGFARFTTDSRTPNYGRNIGAELGIPGVNGPAEWQGDWPLFDIAGYEEIGVQEQSMPYARKDEQYQYVANFTWTKKKHEIRFGLDLNKQNMNHLQPEGGDDMGARGRFNFESGPTRLCRTPDGRGGCSSLSPSTSQINALASFLLGLPTRLGRNFLTETPYTTRNWGYSFYARDRWQARRNLTLTYGLRWEYFPVPTRATRGLERYDPETNQMVIGGVGSIPEDMGVDVKKALIGPRFGIAYRATRTLVIRAGYGLTNDPYPMARTLRTNHPTFVELVEDAPNTWQPAGSLRTGIPPIPIPDLGNGIIDIPANVYAIAVPHNFRRGYIQSWNFTIQKHLRAGLVAEVGYVATRQTRQLGLRNLNWAPIGTGVAGRQLVSKFGRTAATDLFEPIGGSHYDSMQARLERRFARGIGLKVNYTWGRSITTSGESNSDGELDINIPEYYYLNRRVSSFDRTHKVSISNITELPFGKGRRWIAGGGLLSTLAGGWQANSIVKFYGGTPFTVTASATSLNAPGNPQQADQVKPVVEILGGTGRGDSWFDPFAFAPVNEPRFGTAGFNILRGPGVATWDFGVFRDFRVSEKVNVQFRMESFNFTNTPRFGNPGTNRSSMSLNADGTIRSLGGYTEITSGGGERQFRFGLRIAF